MFYERLKELCSRDEITLTGLVMSLGLSTSKITAWKNGTIPKGDILLKIANYFDVSIDYLVGNANPDTPPSTGGVWIPVLGNVAAGVPISAVEDVLGYEEISADLTAKGEYFALQIKGDSMSPRICDGDVVIVRIQSTIESGDIAIVMVNGEDATCKKVTFTEAGMMLTAYNATAYPPYFYSQEEVEKLPVHIIGKVIELRGKL